MLSILNLKNILITVVLLFSLSCQATRPQIQLPNGKMIDVKVVTDPTEQSKGLSGVKKENFSKKDSMLFWYSDSTFRKFWMPDTYFNLYIIFLDENLKIIYIDKNAKAHPGRMEPPAIYRTPTVFSRFVLEMRADSELVQSLKVGDVLKWKYKVDLLKMNAK